MNLLFPRMVRRSLKPVSCPDCGRATARGECCLCAAGAPPRALERGDDEAASDRDVAAEGRDRAAELRDRDGEDRDVQSRQQDQTASRRRRSASDRDQALSDQNQAASGQDQRSADEDQRSGDDELAAAGDANGTALASYRRGVLARRRTRRQRDSVSVLREDVAAQRSGEANTDTTNLLAKRDRVDAAEDRHHAAEDRGDAADDRRRAADERVEALVERTEHAVAAQRALETLECMSDGFETLDSEWRFTYLNPQAETILGCRRDELLGKKLWEEFPDAVGTRFYDEYHRAVRDQVPVRFEAVHEPSGRTHEVRAYPVLDGLAIYFTDVTDQRVRDAHILQSERLEALGRVTAGVAHDFNNLLTAVGGFAQLGRSVSIDKQAIDCFDQIEAASENAVALTRQMLVFAREQVLSPVVLELNEVVEAFSLLLRQLVPPRIDLVWSLSAAPVPVYVDRSQLEQVLLNLAVNSRDAIPTDGSITIGTRNGSSTNGTAAGVLQVTDTGSGIAEDVLPHIFDPFFTTKPATTGTGLGLATIYGIVSQSGGSIAVNSTVNVGTTMTVALPSAEWVAPRQWS
jgi:PAS domain S-box-containing protein